MAADAPVADSPRAVVARSLAAAAAAFPRLPRMPLRTEGLAPRDAALAVAVHRLALQRWLTIEHLLDRFLNQPVVQIEPALRGLLVSAAAPILFMDRQPCYAVVDEAVTLARQMVRGGAAGLVNAVLRRLSELVDQTVRGETWSPGDDRLPLADGYVCLSEPCLPPPENWGQHLAVATSHPVDMVHQWARCFGRRRTRQLCLDNLRTPPTIVAVEPGFDATRHEMPVEPHIQDRFVLWHGRHGDLVAFLAAHPARRVQDPGAAAPIRAVAAQLAPTIILDCCAGRGTKTAQLAETFPDATVIATDVDRDRLTALRRRFEANGAVRVVNPDQLVPSCFGKADLILLDVPCSNTGVLARRPEAKYRYCRKGIGSLVRLQRRIVKRAIQLAASGGTILYSSCSLDDSENQQQIRWLANEYHLEVQMMELKLPSGSAEQYQDGCFYALLRTRL